MRQWLVEHRSVAWAVAVALLATVAVSAVGVAFSQAHKATWTQTGALFGTAVLIFWYAWETRRMAEAAHQQLCRAGRAEVGVAADDVSTSGVRIVLRNVGLAAATSLHLFHEWDTGLNPEGDESVLGRLLLEKLDGPVQRMSATLTQVRPYDQWYAPFLGPQEETAALVSLPRDEEQARLIVSWHDVGAGPCQVRCWGMEKSEQRGEPWVMLSCLRHDESAACPTCPVRQACSATARIA